MTNFTQGDIAFFNLDPAKGSETKKQRPCIVISNNNYNIIMNTVIIVPISSSDKYITNEKYRKSPFFVNINDDFIKGTALLQHIRTVDPRVRAGNKITKISENELSDIIKVIKEIF